MPWEQCRLFLYAAKQKEKLVFPPEDRAPQSPTSLRAYLSSVLRWDALGILSGGKVAGSPVDQPYSTLLEAVQKNKKNARAVQEMQIGTFTAYIGYIYTMLQQKKRQLVVFGRDLAQFMGAYIFYLGLSMYFNVIDMSRYEQCQW